MNTLDWFLDYPFSNTLIQLANGSFFGYLEQSSLLMLLKSNDMSCFIDMHGLFASLITMCVFFGYIIPQVVIILNVITVQNSIHSPVHSPFQIPESSLQRPNYNLLI